MHSRVDAFRRETFDSAVHLGVSALNMLGHDENSAQRAGALFIEHDEETLRLLADLWGDDKSYGVAVRQRLEDLKQVLLEDRKQDSSPGIPPQTSEAE